ncbi:hypothetical protein [Actinomadura sp. CNU-125]|uniref:hypothetical protein n=1 Tax=Actinomadura sp. CNU-125 TaxID=1904961 RepID=UPI000A7F9344|nr:hypothetical protein [Actinomadura sp. CNU-125]
MSGGTSHRRDPAPEAQRNGPGIRVVGARENNLKDVSLVVPRDRITVFVGVSGSGKSSLAFDTVAVEAQRQLNAAFPVSVRNQLPKYERPHVEAVLNLTAPIVVDQQPLTGNARSTVGTITDVYSLIRVLFAQHTEPGPVHPSLYSFNAPNGMCTGCEGIGRALRPDPDLMLDSTKSLDEGPILVPGYPVGSPGWQYYANYEGLDAKKRLSDYSEEEWHTLLHGVEGTVDLTYKNGRTQTIKYEGLVAAFTKKYLKRDIESLGEKTREMAKRFIAEGPCPDCDGARLNPTALATRIGGRNIAEWSRMQISDLAELLAGLDDGVRGPMTETVRESLVRIEAIGLGYLSLDRATTSLSGGEGQRLKMVKHLGSDLTGLTYFFDEPSAGLHPRNVGQLNALLRALRDKGNTVLVVEHDPDVIAIADHVVEIGPGAGDAGGRIVFEGPVEELLATETVTGTSLRGSGKVKTDCASRTAS